MMNTGIAHTYWSQHRDLEIYDSRVPFGVLMFRQRNSEPWDCLEVNNLIAKGYLERVGDDFRLTILGVEYYAPQRAEYERQLDRNHEDDGTGYEQDGSIRGW